MAALNPSVPEATAPKMISDTSEQPKSASYNALADQSSSDLVMKDLANIIPTLAEAGDRYTKNAIDTSIYDNNNKLNTEFGANDTIALNNNDVPTIPGQLEDSANNLKRIGSAYSSGAISKTTFDVKVASMASDLRAQYSSPYLRDYIDKKVADVTGVDPQNQVRKDIFAQVAKNNEAQIAEQKQRQEYVGGLAKDGIAIPGWENMSMPQIIDQTAAGQKILGDAKRATAIASAKKDVTEVDDRTNMDNAQHGAWAFVAQNISNVKSGMGQTQAQIDSSVNELVKASTSPQRKAELMGQVTNLSQKIMNEARVYVLKNYAGNNLTEDKITQILAPLKIYTDNYTNAIMSGDAVAIKATHDQLEVAKDSDDLVSMTVPEIRAGASTNRLLGGLASAAILERTIGPITTAQERNFANKEKNNIFGAPGGESADQAYTNLKTNGAKDPQTYKSVVTLPVGIIQEPTSHPDAVKAAVRTLYAPDNTRFIAKLPDSEKASTYATMYSPTQIKAMERIRDGGDIDSWNQFVTSSKAQFGPVIRQAAMNIQQDTDAPSKMDVTYNTETHQFTATMKPGVATKGGARTILPVPPEFNQMNQVLKSIVPVLEADGENPETFVKGMFANLGMSTPRDGWQDSGNMLVKMGGAVLSHPNHLQPGDGVENGEDPRFAFANAAYSQALIAREGVEKGPAAGAYDEVKELIDRYNKTEDPQIKQMLKTEIMSQKEQNFHKKTGPLSNQNADEDTSSMNTIDGKMEPGLNQTDNDVLNAFTNHQGLADAIKSGDKGEILKNAALAAASIIPFPGGKVGEKALIEGGAKIVDHTSFLARGVDKDIAIEKQIRGFESAMNPEQLAQHIESLEGQIPHTPPGALRDRMEAEHARLTDHLDQLEKNPGGRNMDTLNELVQKDPALSQAAKATTDFAETAAKKAASKYTPEELGKRINQVQQFSQLTKDPDLKFTYDQELNVLLRAREIIKEGIKTVK